MTRAPHVTTDIEVPLICPHCKAESETMLTKGEPKGTVKIILPCYECGTGRQGHRAHLRETRKEMSYGPTLPMTKDEYLQMPCCTGGHPPLVPGFRDTPSETTSNG